MNVRHARQKDAWTVFNMQFLLSRPQADSPDYTWEEYQILSVQYDS